MTNETPSETPNNPIELAKKLKSDIDVTDWNELMPHESRSALVMVDASLDLAEVGAKIALDDVESIKEWMDKKLIERPSDELKNQFKENPHSKQFQFLIIQPYVLAQRKQQED